MRHRIVFSIFLARVFLFLPFMTVAGCLPILIEEWKIGAAKACSIVSGFYLGYAVSLLIFSWSADHIGAKRSVLYSAGTTAASCIAFALLADDFRSTLLLYTLIGLCQGGVYTPLIILFREGTDSEQLGTAVGWLIASTSIGYAASIALTGLAIGLSGWRLAFTVTGLLPVVGAAILMVAINSLPNVIHPLKPESGLWVQLHRNRSARQLLGGYMGHNWELHGLWTLGPTFVAASFVLGGATTSLATQWSAQFITILHLGGAFAVYIIGRLSDRLGRRTVLIWVAAIAAGASLSIGWTITLSPYLVAMLFIALSFFSIGDSAVLSAAMAERVEPGSLGAVLAVRSLTGFIIAAISPVVVGWVIDILRANQASDTVVWGTAFAILGFGGLFAVFFALRLSDDR